MKSIFKWLHLSDIHFQTGNTAFNTKQLRDKLPLFLKKEEAHVDSIIITGDFRFAPEKEENPNKVVTYIKEIAAAVGICDMKKVVTLPGNHDLSRSTTRIYMVDGVKSHYDPNIGTIDQSVLQSLLNDFTFYNVLHEELGDSSTWREGNPHCLVEFEGCNLLVLNTALIASGDSDSGHLLLGSSYIEALISSIKNNNPTIVVGHHAFEELDPSENKVIAHFLEQNGINLYICGHSHDHWFRAFGENGKEVNVGCMIQPNNSVKASFCIGELFEDGTVKINSYTWDMAQKDWFIDKANERTYNLLYSIEADTEDSCPKENIKKNDHSFSIDGYTLLGSLGSDGIKYYWKKNNLCVESIAFNRRLKNAISEEDNTTSAYTISTSLGRQLSATNQQCRFCETGTKSFGGNLSADDIALQCIFMAEYDSNCPSYPQVRTHKREFAFMGQGEPGYNYAAVKQAIIMTDYVMKKLGQIISRYVISTCGVSGLIPSLIQDIKSGIFQNKVTIHLSLHDIGKSRSEIMPISETEDYQEIIQYCKALYRVTGEKIGVGILMFDKYQCSGVKNRTLTPEKLEEILSALDNNVFKIDLCTVNKTSAGQQKHQLSNEAADKLYGVATKRGFEVKLFTSFGDNQQSGCGMLSSSSIDIEQPGNTTIKHFNTAVDLLLEAKKYCLANL